MVADVDSPDKHSMLAERLDEAEELARKILATQPDNPDALNGLGLIHVQQERFDQAINLFEQAHAVDPDRGDFVENLIKAFETSAKSMAHASRFSAAIKTLERALVMRPGDASLTCRMSFVLSLAKRHGEALAAADRALSKAPESPEALDVRGLALLGLNQLDHAIKSFRAALDHNVKYAPAYSNLGLAYRAQGEHRSAISCFDEAIRLDENNLQAYNNLGISLLDMGDVTQAEAALRNALSIEPDYAQAHFNLSRVLLMAENFADGWKENEWRWLCPEFPSTWREFPPAMWDELLSSPGCHFINLQYGEVDEDLAGVFERTGVNVFNDDAVDPLTSAEDWFAQIAALDHVISVDNSTIQVSGSLGIPTWTLLSKVPEWRFGLNRLDHLWHPSIRIFRQHKKGEWELLMSEVAFTFASLLESEGYVSS